MHDTEPRVRVLIHGTERRQTLKVEQVQALFAVRARAMTAADIAGCAASPNAGHPHVLRLLVMYGLLALSGRSKADPKYGLTDLGNEALGVLSARNAAQRQRRSRWTR